MMKSLSKSARSNWKRALSMLLVLLTVLGMLPTTAFASDAVPTYGPTGSFEVNVAGASGWSGAGSALPVYDSESGGAVSLSIPAATAVVLLEDNGGDRVKIGIATNTNGSATAWEGGSVTKTGWVDKDKLLVNLPDVLPSITYNRTDVKDQYSARLGRYEYIVPCVYAQAEQLAEVQKDAMAGGETLVVSRSTQSLELSFAKGDPAQLHDYDLDGAAYQKYESWTVRSASSEDEERLQRYAAQIGAGAVDRAYSVCPYTAFAEVAGRTVRRAPARASSNPTGGTGGLNPGSPGGQKPTSTTVAWTTDQERTFLRFTLIEFPGGVVTDLNNSDYST